MKRKTEEFRFVLFICFNLSFSPRKQKLNLHEKENKEKRYSS